MSICKLVYLRDCFRWTGARQAAAASGGAKSVFLGDAIILSKVFAILGGDPQSGHGLPVDQGESEMSKYELESRYERIVNRIGQNCKGDKFIFVFANDYNSVHGTVQWLKEKYMLIKESRYRSCHGSSNVNELQFSEEANFLCHERIACIEDLCLALISWIGKTTDEFEIKMEDELLPDQIYEEVAIHPKSICQVHFRMKNPNCALGHANRILY